MSVTLRRAIAPRVGRGYRWVIVFLCAFGVFQVTFHAYALSPLLPRLMAELSIGNSQAGSLLSAYFITYGLVQIPIGYVADRLGSRRVMLASLSIFTVGAFSLPLSFNYPSALALRMFTGLGASAIYVPGLRLIPAWFPQRRLGLVFGLISSGSSLGTSVALLVMPVLAGVLGWRGGYWVAAGSVPVALLLIWLFLARSPAEVGVAGGQTTAAAAGPAAAFLPALKRVLANRSLYPYGIGTAIYYGGFAGIAAWVPTFLSQDLGYSSETAGLIAALFPLMNIVTAPLAGALADRTGRRKWVFLGGIGATGLSAVLFAVASPHLPLAGLAVLMVVFSISTSATVITFSIVPNLVESSVYGTAVGLMNSYYFIGAVLYPPLLGAVVDLTGARASAFYTIGVLAVIGVVAVALGRERLPGTLGNPSPAEDHRRTASAGAPAGADSRVAVAAGPGRPAPVNGLELRLHRGTADDRVWATVAGVGGRVLASGPAEPGRLRYFPASFAATLAEDVLLGGPDPAAALTEIVRVTRHGGYICLHETDWATLVVMPGSPTLVERVRAALRCSATCPASGADLVRWCRMVGLNVIDEEAEPYLWTDRLTGGPAGGPAGWLHRAVRHGLLTRAEAGDLHDEWTAARARGALLIAVTRWQVQARPADAP